MFEVFGDDVPDRFEFGAFSGLTHSYRFDIEEVATPAIRRVADVFSANLERPFQATLLLPLVCFLAFRRARWQDLALSSVLGTLDMPDPSNLSEVQKGALLASLEFHAKAWAEKHAGTPRRISSS